MTSLRFLCLLFLAWSSGLPLYGQEAASPAPAGTTPAEVRAAIERVETDTALEEGLRETIVKRLTEALAQLEAAATFDGLTASVKKELEEGPELLVRLREASEQRREGIFPEEAREEADPSADATPETLAARLAAERVKASELNRQIRELESELGALEGRPDANRDRLAALSRSLAEAEQTAAELAEAPQDTALWRADLLYARARIQALKAELGALEQEALVFDLRRERTQLQRELANSDLKLVRERLARLERRSGALVADRIGEAERRLGELGLQEAGAAPGVRELVEGTRLLASGNQALLARAALATEEWNHANANRERLRREAESLRAQVGIGGLEESFAEVAIELWRTLPSPQSLRGEMEARRREIAEARLAAFRLERELEQASSPEGETEALIDRLRAGGMGEDELAEIRPSLSGLLENRAQLLRDAVDANRRLASQLGEIDLVVRETLAEAEELRNFLGERLVWVASSPPLGRNALTGLRTSFLALAGPEALLGYGRALARIDLGRWILGGLLALALLLPRPRLRRFLQESGQRTRRISTDRIATTLQALVASLWLALPLPAGMAFLGWTLSSDPSASVKTYALGKGLVAPVLLLLVLRFASVLCQREGVAEGHFRWRRSLLDPLRRSLFRLTVLYVPAHFLLAVWWHNGGDLASFQGPGRLVFVLVMISLSLILHRFFQSQNGELSETWRSREPHALRRLWRWSVILLPLALAILAALGHFLTAVTLAYLMQKTGFVVFGGVLISAFLTRWAILNSRRMALAEALAQREAKRSAQEAALGAVPQGNEGEELSPGAEPLPPEEEESVDWTAVGEQTRYLIRAFVTLFVLFGCWLAWSEALPTLDYMDGRHLVGEVGFGDLIRVLVILAVATILFRNLPGLLELGVLRVLEVESGVRNAVVTLCQYLVIAVAAMLSFHILGLDWSRFGWIAAALSVGIGFGLQEVVANFVSGLIVLFERPIRVGDIVTVGGVDGTVTKIRIRATVITTGDRKELIVPNKEFITGKILNWTLSSPVTRLVFPVEVVSGTDVDRACALLQQIAREQSGVLADPAPDAVVESFSPGSVRLSLRCFVGSPSQRGTATHQINLLIHQRFAAEGIAMPALTQDIRLLANDPPGGGASR